MLIEQVSYTLHPGRAPELIEAYRTEGMAIVRRHIPEVLGFLVADTGGLDDVSHLWAYPDAAARRHAIDGLLADEDWRRFAKTYGHLLVSRRSVLWAKAL